MLLGIFSDTHLGFGVGEQYEEAFDRFKESLKTFQERGVKAIIHAGDLFDDSTPTQEVWLKTFECFAQNNGSIIEIEKETRAGKKILVQTKGIPIIAIHGTHEHRGKDFANALEVLEEAHCLVHIHGECVYFLEGADKVCIHGLGGVPERNAKQVLETLNPKPKPNSTNIFVMHQSFSEFLPFDDTMIATLSLSDLPMGFDLIIDGHLHWTNEQNIPGKRFLLTGSTIFTQMKKLESEKNKGVFVFDSITKKLEFVPFKNQRKLFYEKISFDSALPEKVKLTVEQKIANIVSKPFELKPLIRFKLVGTLAKGYSQSDIKFSLPEDKAIFSISKEFSSDEFKRKIESFKEEHLKRKSITEVGMDILEKNVEEAKLENFDSRRIFELLSNDETEKAEEVLLKGE